MSHRVGLVIVDVQNGFINEHTQAVPSRVAELVKRVEFSQILCTQFVNAPRSPFREILGWHALDTEYEISLTPEIEAIGAPTMQKRTYTPDIPSVVTVMDQAAVEMIYVAGIDTDICVLMTAVGLFEVGRRSAVLMDASMSHGGPTHHEAAGHILPRFIGESNVIMDSSHHFGLG